MTVAKVFTNRGSQAICLPAGFRVSAKKVFLKKTPEGFLVMERDPWEVFDQGCRELSDHFMTERIQPPIEKRASATRRGRS